VGGLDWVVQHLGLAVFTLVALALVLYLGYSMLQPERF
jgi:K+-transporting ATPase KdpF subunit